MIVYRRKINMVPGGRVAVVNMSQYDSDVTLEFELYASEGTFVVQDGTTVLIRGTKPDGNGISLDGTLESTQDPETGQYVHLVTVEVTQQMTAVAGKALYELSLRKDNAELNTANFVLDIERAPLDADTVPSESVIREIDKAVEDYLDEHEIVIDDTLTQQGKAADAKAVRDALNEITPGLSEDAKAALLACFEHVAWIDDDGQDYYDALEAALSQSSERERLFGQFTAGISVIRSDHVAVSPNYEDYVAIRKSVAARACIAAPIANQNFVFTVTDPSKYNIMALPIVNLTKLHTDSTAYYDDYCYLTSGAASWETSSYVTSDYVWIALKKMNGTEFTSEELANSAEAVFTYTQVSVLPLWKYEASDGDLLSETGYVTKSTGGSGGTESISNNKLVLTTPVAASSSSSNFLKFSLSDQLTTSGKIATKAKLTVCPNIYVESLINQSTFRLQISNGSAGAQFFIGQDEGNICVSYNEGTTKKVQATTLPCNEFHVFECVLSNGSQKLLIDGDTVVDTNTLSSSYCTSTAIFNQASSYSANGTTTEIEWIEFYDEV